MRFSSSGHFLGLVLPIFLVCAGLPVSAQDRFQPADADDSPAAVEAVEPAPVDAAVEPAVDTAVAIEPAPVDATPANPPASPGFTLPPVTTPAATSPELPADAPNFLILIADDHSTLAAGPWLADVASWLAPANDLTPLTPQLDRLCALGARFRATWAVGLDQTANRTALLDGHHPAHPEAATAWSLPAELQQRGYATARFGHHTGPTPGATSGFGHYEITDPRYAQLNPLFITDRLRGRESGHETPLTSQRAQAWMRRHHSQQPRQPFFVVCQFHSPGPQPLPTPATADLFGPELLLRPDQNLWEFHPGLPDDPRLQDPAPPAAAGLRTTQSLATDYPARGADCFFTGANPRLPALLDRLEPAQRADWLASYHRRNELRRQASHTGALDRPEDRLRWESQRYLRQYLGALRAVDAELGALLDFLATENLSETTVVLYTSDQGAILGAHGLTGQNWADPETFRVPWAIAWPGHIAPGLTLETPAQLTDLAPTLLELLGLRVSALRQDQRITGMSHARALLGLAEVPVPRPALLLADSAQPPFQGVIDATGFAVQPPPAITEPEPEPEPVPAATDPAQPDSNPAKSTESQPPAESAALQTRIQAAQEDLDQR